MSVQGTVQEGAALDASHAPEGGATGRRLLSALVLLATAGIVVANRRDLPAAWRALRHARPAWVALAAVLGGAGLVDVAAEHVAAQRTMGLRPRAWLIAPLAWAARFLNLVAKSNGIAGLVLFRSRARREGRPEAPVVAAYLLATVLDPLAFAAVLAVAFVLLVGQGRFSPLDAVAGVVFVAYLLVTVGTVVAALRSRRAVRALYELPGRIGRRLHGAPQPVGAATVDHHNADELYEAVAVLRHRPRSLWAPGLAALGVDLLGVAQLWAVLMAVGAHPGVELPLVAYAVSTLFGIVGIVPAGLGAVEVSLGAVLVSYGVAMGPAAAAVVLYRVVELWIPLAVGGLAASRLAQISPPNGPAVAS